MSELVDFNDERAKVNDIISSGNYYFLLQYKNIDLSELDFMSDKNIKKIFQSCKDNNVIKHVIDNIIDLEYIDTTESKIIHYICRYCNFEIVKHLLSKNVKLNHPNDAGHRPLGLVCFQKNKDHIIKYLIDNGMDVTLRSKNYYPIHDVCINGKPWLIEYLLQKGGDLGSKTNDSWTSIHFICKYQPIHVIMKYLSQNKYDFECETDKKLRPIHIAASRNLYEVVVKMDEMGLQMDCRNDFGYTPLANACRLGSPSLVMYLLKYKIGDGSVRDGDNVYSAVDLINMNNVTSKTTKEFLVGEVVK
jgi:ankyrin repeat protein